DAVYLNDLYRARAERAGVVYVDIWDGFVDESGKYSNFGPDYEGQMRRLRSSDGIFFTKSGAVKLAHYVEREIRRYMNSRVTPVALPAGPLAPAAPDGKPAARPIAGPVIPLTVTPGNSEELLGSAGNSSAHGDAIATRVLVKGEPVAAPRGRADDFTLQRGNDDSLADPVAPVPAGALASPPAEPPRTEPAPAPQKTTSAPKSSGTGKTTQNTLNTLNTQNTESTHYTQNTGSRPKPPRDDVPRPPREIPFGGGWFRWASARQHGRSHQEFVDGMRGLAGLAYRPDHPRMAAPHIACGEHLWQRSLIRVSVCRYVAALIEGYVQCFEHPLVNRMNEAHGKQNQIGVDLEFRVAHGFELRIHTRAMKL